MALSSRVNDREFSFRRDATYTNDAPRPWRPFVVKRKIEPRRGQVCPGCGTTRSCTNLCECNS